MSNIVQDFYIGALELEVASTLAMLHGGSQTSVITADGQCELNVPQSWAMNTFQFLTDSVEVDNSNLLDVKFRMISYQTTTNDITGDVLKMHNPRNIIPGHASMISGQVPFYRESTTVQNHKTLAADYIRHVALEKFTTSEAVDIFKNELEVRSDLINSTAISFREKIDLFNDSGSKIAYTDGYDWIRMETTLSNIDTEVYNTESLQSDAVDKGITFPSRVIFSQLLDTQSSRFINLNTFESKEIRYLYLSDGSAAQGIDDDSKAQAMADAGIDVWRKIPFMVGDKIYFKIIVNPGDNKDKDGLPVSVRSYRVKLNVVSDDSVDLVANTGTGDDDVTIHYKHPWSSEGYSATTYIPYLNNNDPAPENVAIA